MTYVRHAFTAVVLAAAFASHFILGDATREADPVAAMRMASDLPIAEPGSFAAVVKPNAAAGSQSPAVSPLGDAMRTVAAQDKWVLLVWSGVMILMVVHRARRLFRTGQTVLHALGLAGSMMRRLIGFAKLKPRSPKFVLRAAPAPKPQFGAAPSRPAAEFPTRAKFFGG